MTWITVSGNTVRCPHCQEPLWEKGSDSIVKVRKHPFRHTTGPTLDHGFSGRCAQKKCKQRYEFIVQVIAKAA